MGTMFMNSKRTIFLLASGFSLLALSGCGGDDSDDNGAETTEVGEADISVIVDKFYHTSTTVSVGEEFITITSTNLPDNKSMYWPTSNSLYEAYDEPDNADFKKNPNEIESQNIVYKVPRFPVKASSAQATGFGPMGVAVNGVTFFNDQAAPGDDILDELNTFDQYEAHPENSGTYHYHLEPTWLTQELGDEEFLGVLLDGFPVYGPKENGKVVTNDDLDDFHGHTHATADFPDGIYHYHITAEQPWINGGDYYGTVGTVTQ